MTPQRPRSLDPRELGFRPRRAVSWLSPLLLLRTGLSSLLALIFGAYMDKRELQGAIPARIYRHDHTDGELWLDYVADLGDGFHATYSVAYLLGQPALTVDGHELPRGHVLIMGGDRVYPTASMREYEDRCKGPYTAALPAPPPDRPPPTLYALPGNHDWYDGLTAFLRLFVGARAATTSAAGGPSSPARTSRSSCRTRGGCSRSTRRSARTLTTRSWSTSRRPRAQLTADDRVILVVPTPGWVKAEANPTAYDTIDFFIRKIIDADRRRGAAHHRRRHPPLRPLHRP